MLSFRNWLYHTANIQSSKIYHTCFKHILNIKFPNIPGLYLEIHTSTSAFSSALPAGQTEIMHNNFRHNIDTNIQSGNSLYFFEVKLDINDYCKIF